MSLLKEQILSLLLFPLILYFSLVQDNRFIIAPMISMAILATITDVISITIIVPSIQRILIKIIFISTLFLIW